MRAMGDTNELVNEKLKHALKAGLAPILCVGEKKRDAEGFYLHELKEQITVALAGIPRTKLSTMLFAYEPVWAIGQGAIRQTTPEECQESVIFIKKIIADLYDPKVIEGIKILYGGSVDEKNAELFIKFGGVSGLLIGRACLDPKKLAKIIKSIS
jgi:triosephosphate isomerase